jgi:hypothetical protein
VESKCPACAALRLEWIVMTNGTCDASPDPLLQRVCNEYLEMPGLQLTRRQAQRLWGLDEMTCHRVLDILVEAKFLRRTAHGGYARTSDGPVAGLPILSA